MELRYIHIFQRERNPDILRVNLAPGKQDKRLLYPHFWFLSNNRLKKQAGVSRYTVNLLFFPKRKNILHILQINPSFFCDLIHCKLRLGML